MSWFLYFLLLLIVIYIIVCLVYYFIQERMLFVATKTRPNYKFNIGQEYDEYFLESKDGGLINTLLIKGEKDLGLIIYLHGNTGTLKRWALVATELTTYGYDVLIHDFRGYGKSKGKRNEANLHADSKVVYELAKTLYPSDKITLYGRSLGTGMAIKLAAECKASRLILETPYYSMTDVAKYHTPFIPINLLMRYTFKSYQWIEDVSCPIYIFHGTKDLIVPYSHGLKLYELVKSRPDTKMVTIPRGRHSNLNSYPLFREKMHEFLEAYPNS